jgi:hypothetical protein
MKVIAQIMKVIVQNTATCDYLGRFGEWTSDLNLAFDFAKTMLASKFCKDRKLENAHIGLKLYNSEYDVSPPIR